jgi:hypothetical protein
MLVDVRCSEFKSNGEIRSPIKFNPGLNTVLGDEAGSNSIGKSTFLMIVDFVFGGNDYIEKSRDVQSEIGQHLIQFAFKFGAITSYFSRDTINHNYINKCDANYQPIEKLDIKEFREWLKKEYDVKLVSLSFREIVSRYFRIYGRENLNEKKPLHIVQQESENAAIETLIKLFGKYANIEQLNSAYKEASAKTKVYRKAVNFELITEIKKLEYTNNQKELEVLNEQLEQIAKGEGKLKSIEVEEANRISEIKKELANLRRQHSRLQAELERIETNSRNNVRKLQDDFSSLNAFFPFVDIRKIEEIEQFHAKLEGILNNEFAAEKQRIVNLLDATNSDIQTMKNALFNNGWSDAFSRKQLDEYAAAKGKMDSLKQKNRMFEESKRLIESVKIIKEQLINQRKTILSEIENEINIKMNELNDIIYNKEKKAPILGFNDSGTTYTFQTPQDTGTGTSYKSLVVFDLSILNLTQLPALIHDSVVLKQIGDMPLEKILELYQMSDKQVFIALDKGGSYTERTKEILNQTAVIHLSNKGEELFGRSWNIKNNERKNNGHN